VSRISQKFRAIEIEIKNFLNGKTLFLDCQEFLDCKELIFETAKKFSTVKTSFLNCQALLDWQDLVFKTV